MELRESKNVTQVELAPRLEKPQSYVSKVEIEPYRVCRRVNILRDYPDDKIKIYP
ncbi:helix-turn-helix domain-containing protein [Acinetobacter soli]|uniref:helix-turn-helix domain-containing protein n=1 Tax=Acinetobacter soli TaxID=487316 RepID=UPI001D18A721|nr:helix-turn-helix transcriptional regulator [Acinetobacter soli]